MKNRIHSFQAFAASLFMLLAMTSCEDKTSGTAASPVKIEIEEVGDDFVSFTLSAPDAALLTYKQLAEFDASPSADEVLRSGVQADPSVYKVYTIGGLSPETVYRIAAAAMYSDGSYSDVAEVGFETTESDAVVPTLVLRDVTPVSTSVSFTLVPDKAEKAAYLCVLSSDEVPSAAEIIESGHEADPSKTDLYSVPGLLPETEYTLVAAAVSADGTYSEVASEPFATLEAQPAAIGDYYYSDGTWSSGAEGPVAGKECVGIVVLAGRGTVTNGGTDTGVYYTKDGHSRLENINGYVVSLNDVASGTEYAWGSWDVDGDSGVGTTHSDSDFEGYYNTSMIKAKAEEKAGGLSDDAVNNYPAAYAAVVLYENEVSAPESSSGWFLPSAQQLHYLFMKNEEINAALNSLGDAATPVYRRNAIYWSSSEQQTENGTRYWAYMVNLDSSNITPGYISGQRKNKEYKVRPWLVF